MKRFRDILAVASSDDGRTRGIVSLAADLARRNGADLTLFDVVESVPARRRFVGGQTGDIDVEMALAEERVEVLRDLAGRVDDVPVRVGVANGSPFLEILKRAEAFDHDLVVVAPDAGRRARGLSGASTAMHLLRKCPVPVWVEVDGAGLRPDVAVAVRPFDPDDGGLNRTLLELSSSLAARRNGTLHVVSAWRLEGESLLRKGRVGASPAQVDAMVAEAYQEAYDGLEALLDSVTLGDSPIEVHLDKGEAADVIVSTVGRLRPGVVVMGTLARAGIPGVVMGNTAERVLGDVDASILAVKPPGFEPPMRF